MKNARFLLALVALALLLSGCGNKGPLAHPDDAPDRAENS
jgi:predicted small lipoprotein YifL